MLSHPTLHKRLESLRLATCVKTAGESPGIEEGFTHIHGETESREKLL